MLWIGITLAVVGQVMAYGVHRLASKYAGVDIAGKDVQLATPLVYSISLGVAAAKLITHVGLGMVLLYVCMTILVRFK